MHAHHSACTCLLHHHHTFLLSRHSLLFPAHATPSSSDLEHSNKTIKRDILCTMHYSCLCLLSHMTEEQEQEQEKNCHHRHHCTPCRSSSLHTVPCRWTYRQNFFRARCLHSSLEGRRTEKGRSCIMCCILCMHTCDTARACCHTHLPPPPHVLHTCTPFSSHTCMPFLDHTHVRSLSVRFSITSWPAHCTFYILPAIHTAWHSLFHH